MDDLESQYKELKKKNKALKHHLKEEAASVQKLTTEVADFKDQLRQKVEKVESLQLDNQRLTKRIGVLQELENKRQAESMNQPQQTSYFGGGFFGGNSGQQVQQIKEELEKVNEDLALAQEELIAKIQENEMVNIKIFEVEKEFQEKEKSLDAKINDLQKRIHQLDQDIHEKEQECEKLREDLRQTREQQEIMQQNNKALEQRYQEDQQKWANLTERVGQRMEEHKFVYQNRYPIDPFKRDNVFHENAQLFKELSANSNHTKIQRQFNMQNHMTQQKMQDFNLLNVIKTDYKTQQRQKEIINVISDMSAQISQSLAKCMQSFISQIDGQKPVANNMEMQYMTGSYNNMGDDSGPNPNGGSVVQGQNMSSNSKGDISQQIMDSHGSRVKKYGIYIDQLVEKIKMIQNYSQDLFDIISLQSANLIDVQKHQQFAQQQNKDHHTDELQNKDRQFLPHISISQAAEKFSLALAEVVEILESFYDEEQILFQAGIDVQYQEFNIKFINDAILQNIVSLQQHLLMLKLNKCPNSYVFKQPHELNKYEIIEMIVDSKFDQFTGLFKAEIQSLAQNFMKKKETLKNEGCKLLINGQVSKSGMPFEVKSNNVMVFREQLVADFMEQSHLLERYHTACLSAKNLFQHQSQSSNGPMGMNQNPNLNQQEKNSMAPRINIQLSINKSVMRAKNRLSHLSNQLDRAQLAISYEEQMRNMQLLELNKKEMIQTKAELFTVRKDYEKLDNQQQKQGIQFQKYKTLAKIAQEKQKKQQGTLDDVHKWLGELKQVANYEDGGNSNMSNSFVATTAHSETGLSQTNSQKYNEGNDGVLCQKIGQLEVILNNKESQSQDNSSNLTNANLKQQEMLRTKFFDIKQIIKLNVDEGARYNKLQREAMTPEDQKPQFTIEQVANINSSSQSNIMNAQMAKQNKDCNDRPLLPINQFINCGQSESQQLHFLQKNYFNKLNQLTQKLHSIDRLSQGTSLQVLQKENEWKDKVAKIEKDFKVKEEALKKDVEQSLTDKQLISKSYEQQLKMMSEHIVELQNQNNQLEQQNSKKR